MFHKEAIYLFYHGKFQAGYSKKKAGDPAAGLFSGLWIAALCLTVLAVSSPALSKSYNLAISSHAFNNNGFIPVYYTCQGSDINPPLAFKNIPPHTASLVLILEDPDAPGGTFTHWLLWNIDPKTRGIDGHAVPHGAVQGFNDFGTIGYGGPCPPPGNAHRYIFELFAVNTILHVKRTITRQDLEKEIHSHIIAHALLTGFYKRK